MKLKKGVFLTIEGIEGVGKTTNVEFICNWLKSNKIDYIRSREPGGTPLAEEIRELLLKPRDEKVSEVAELLLMFAARAQHVDALIKPTLAQGVSVLCDRFTDATYAYQGGGRGMDLVKIEQLEAMVQAELRPDATFLLDVPVKLGLSRAAKRGELDRFEQEDIDFFERVRSFYLARAEQQPERFYIIDASQSLEVVQLDLTKALHAVMEKMQ